MGFEFKIFIGHTSADREIAKDISNNLLQLNKELSSILGEVSIKIFLMETKYDENFSAFKDCGAESSNHSWYAECMSELNAAHLIIMIVSKNVREGSIVWRELKSAADLCQYVPVVAITFGGIKCCCAANTASLESGMQVFQAEEDKIFSESDCFKNLIYYCKSAIEKFFKSGPLIPRSDCLPEERNFVGRENLIKKIDEEFNESNIVILTGIVGSGKNSLAEHYILSKAKEASLHNSQIGFKKIDCSLMHDPGQESIDFNELYCRFTLSEEERTLLSGKKTQLTERSNSVLKQLSSNNYIFLSGWDKKLDSLQKLRTPDVKCRFIITSSNEFVEDPSCDLPIIKIDLESRRAKEDACAIMRSIICDNLARDDEIEDFCEMIGYHTYTLVLIATQLYHKRLRINSKGITKLSEVTEHFKDVKSMNSTESGLTIISIVERLKMSLRLGFESVEDEEFRKLLQKVIILISFFHPDYINDDVLGNFVPWAGAYCFSDTINWLVEMSYLRRNKDRSLSVHPLISEVAYALFDGIDKEDAASIESVLFDYLNKRISDISTSISKYYFTNKIVFKQGESEREELVEQLKHIYFRRLTGFSIEKKARTCFRLGLLSESDVSKSYYADCEQYAWEGLSNPDLEPDKVFLLGELVMSSTWNRSGNNKKEMRNAIERLSQYKEYRTICRCAEEMLDIKDMPNARKLYAEALALSCVQAENNSAQRKIFAEMMKYCKSAAPMVSYNHCQQAIETIEAELDDRLNAEAQNYITELQKTMAEIERKAKDYCTSYVNKANIYDSKINRDKINWTMVRQEYICLVQAIELARLVNDFDDMQYIQNLIDDLLKITNTNADVCADITDEEIEDAHECS